MPRKKQNFETDITRLTEIIEEVENSETSLEDAIKLYKEGLALCTKCGEILTKYDEEIQLLQRENETGQWQTLLQHF